MRSRYLCTLGKTKKLLPMVWLASAALSSPSLFVIGTETVTYYNNHTSVVVVFCADNAGYDNDPLIYSIYQLGIMFAVPTIIMLFCYARVIYVLWLSTHQLASMTAPKRIYDVPFLSGNQRSRNNHMTSSVRRGLGKALTEHKSEVFESRKQVIKMLIAIIVAFLICWGPKLILRVLMKLQLDSLYSAPVLHVKIVLSCLPYIQSCLNPVIYSFMSGNFRKSLRIVFNRRLHRHKESSRFTKIEFELSARTASSDMTKVNNQLNQDSGISTVNANATL
ncbi:hypothetical protein ScPMuIL_000737 [Solemya velum]